MRYKSNLECPDLSPYFRHLDPPIQHAGHDEPSDPDFDPLTCGSWTHDEAAILYNCARQVGGYWLDLGSRLGWTSAHLIVAGCSNVEAVDMEYFRPEFLSRMRENTQTVPSILAVPLKSRYFLDVGRVASYGYSIPFSGCVIDADHDPPQPLLDAQGALRHMNHDCMILLHDTLTGLAVRDAVRWLIDQGFRCRIYWTPNGVACCWRGLPDFVAPDHVSDPLIDFKAHRRTWDDFKDYWGKCE